ncbi:hypothetical protein [Maritalea sp.]|uniref:hypothetical protein n=1 Tax=Maritalea sp. TaxID=2003361 RepID=UPI003EF5AA38
MVHQFGLATYRLGTDAGTLIAEWVTDDTRSAVGIGLARATDANTDRFEGNYTVEYWKCEETNELTLKIEKLGTVYKLDWSSDGKTTNTGFGFVSNGLLVTGYTR